jgi:hypothetical protein
MEQLSEQTTDAKAAISFKHKEIKCGICGNSFEVLIPVFLPEDEGADNFDLNFCKTCQRRYPPSLIKASLDEYDYACRLVTGEIIRFTSAAIHGDYVTLGVNTEEQERPLPFTFDRGIDVRIKDIVWCADAPNGS